MPTAKKPQDRKPAYGGFKKKVEDTYLPSGAYVALKRPGLQKLIEDGVVESLDTLTAIVATETIPKAEGKKPAAPKPPSQENILAALEVMDKIVVYCVIQPPVLAVPADEKDRDESAVYVDDLDQDDKTFIAQFAMGGTRDLETFRKNTAAAVAGVPAG